MGAEHGCDRRGFRACECADDGEYFAFFNEVPCRTCCANGVAFGIFKDQFDLCEWIAVSRKGDAVAKVFAVWGAQGGDDADFVACSLRGWGLGGGDWRGWAFGDEDLACERGELSIWMVAEKEGQVFVARFEVAEFDVPVRFAKGNGFVDEGAIKVGFQIFDLAIGQFFAAR